MIFNLSKDFPQNSWHLNLFKNAIIIFQDIFITLIDQIPREVNLFHKAVNISQFSLYIYITEKIHRIVCTFHTADILKTEKLLCIGKQMHKAINALLSYLNNNLVTQQLIKGRGLPTDCWPHFHLYADTGKRSISHFTGDVCSARLFP